MYVYLNLLPLVLFFYIGGLSLITVIDFAGANSQIVDTYFVTNATQLSALLRCDCGLEGVAVSF